MGLRVALPKGHLKEVVLNHLAKFDITFSFNNDRSYHPLCNLEWIEGRMFASHGVVEMVGHGYFDVGFIGLDLIKEYNFSDVELICDLGLRPVMMNVVGTRSDIVANPPLRPLRIASEYPRLAEKWALQKGIEHIVHHTHGATEAYPPDVADVCLECVETGSTLVENGLVVLEELFRSSTWMIVNKYSLRNRYKNGMIFELTNLLKCNKEK